MEANFDRFFTLIKHLPGATKESIVLQYSNGDTRSLRDFLKFWPSQYRSMMIDLQNMVTALNVETDKEKRQLRCAILNRLSKYGITTIDGWENVNRFLSDPRIAGKALYEMDVVEMKRLIPKLEIILKKRENEIIQIQQIAELN